MTDDTCTFSYVSKMDLASRTTTGIECSWLNLKIEFGEQGEGIPGAKYYKKISEKGPQFFAVKPDQSVWYYNEGKWHQYETAENIRCGKYHSPVLDSARKTSTSVLNDHSDNDDDEPCYGVQD